MSPPSFNAADAAVDLTTSSPVSKVGGVTLSLTLPTLVLVTVSTSVPCFPAPGRSAQEEAEPPGKWKDEEE